MTYLIKEIDVSRIYLANDNPRHDPIENEPEIIQRLIAHEKIKPLARHIANAGHTSPLERIAVITHPKVRNAFITAEGNRRICALKLLADPDKADTEANKKYFRSLSLLMTNPPGKLEAVVFSDMQAARPWMSLRHEGEQGGVGTRPWDANQIARFNAQGDNAQNPNIQASLLIDYARNQKLLPTNELDSISITTMTRYLSNPVFRDTLGLKDSKTLIITVPSGEFNRVVVRFLTDILDPLSGVNSRTKVEDRKQYANKLRSEGVAPTTRGLDPLDATTTPRQKKDNQTGKPATSQRDNRSPDDRIHVIPSKFTAHIKDKVLKRVYDELKKLDAEEFPFASTFLLRAVIEQVATLFLSQNGINKVELHTKLASVADLLQKQGLTDHQLKFLRTMSTDKDNRYSPNTMGHFVHGGAVPTHNNAIKMWDSLEPIIDVIFEAIEIGAGPSTFFFDTVRTMPVTDTPLRYPGGKSQLIPFIIELLKENNLFYGEYAEPFAGGAGIAMKLLLDGYVDRIYLNDVDPAIYCFWHSVLNRTDKFCKLIEESEVTIEEWHKQRQIYLTGDFSQEVKFGFSTLFLNRTNRSGIIKAGVIGGLDQSGNYKLDCRFNKPDLIRKIRRIASYRTQINLSQLDAVEFINTIVPEIPPCTLINLDPPYFGKGHELYTNFYRPDDHATLAKAVCSIQRHWMVTYDDTPEIRNLYKQHSTYSSSLNYSAQLKRVGTELLVLGPSLSAPDSLKLANISDVLKMREQKSRIATA